MCFELKLYCTTNLHKALHLASVALSNNFQESLMSNTLNKIEIQILAVTVNMLLSVIDTMNNILSYLIIFKLLNIFTC
jgi:hypothetical protein